MQLIFAMLSLVNVNTSLIQSSAAKNQTVLAKITENQEKATRIETDKFTKILNNLSKTEASDKNWQTALSVMKYVGVAVTLVAGALLCTTGVGFAVLAAVAIFTATPLFNKLTSALGGAIGKAVGNDVAGSIIATVLVMAVLTIVSFGAEGVIAGVSKLAATGTEVAEESAEAAANSGFSSKIINMRDQFVSNISDVNTFRRGLVGVQMVDQLTNATVQVGNGCNQYQQSELQFEMSPLQSKITFNEQIVPILMKMANTLQSTLTSTVDTTSILTKTNFSTNWQACIAAQQA